MPQSIEMLDNDGATETAGYEFGSRASGTTTTRKLWFRNNGTVALTPNFIEAMVDQLLNGGVGVFKWALDAVTVRPPYGGAAVESVDPGTFVLAAVWYFKIVRTVASPAAQTQPSVTFSFTVADAGQGIDLSWLLPGGPAADGVSVFASEDPDDFTDSLIAELGASAVDFTWDGTFPSPPGTPAGVNTTAGDAPDYGTAPSLGTSPLNFGALAVGEARPLWTAFAPPDPDPGQDYLVALTPSVEA